MGFDPKTLLALSPLNRVHPEDRPAVLDRVAELREARRIPPFRYRYRVQSGAWRMFESAASMYRARDGAFRMVLATRDVTEAANAETALRESEARHRALAEGRRGFVQEIAADGRRVYVSESITECLGYSPQEWLALEVPEPMHPDDRVQIGSLKAAIAAC